MRGDKISDAPGNGGRRLLTALAVASCAVALASCGASAKPSAAAPGGQTRDLAFANCMRSHGVPNFPDPSAGGGIQITAGSGINPRSPAFQSAQKACSQFQANGGHPPATSASEKLAALTFAKCMRAHGQPNFPDPSLTAPVGAPRVLVLRGMVFALPPGVDPKSTAFSRAGAACGGNLP